jgi:SAM-dependent methyltransferase
VVPLDPSRYLELPDAIERLGAAPGDRVLDLASPKLMAVALARAGVDVTSVDAFQAEVDTWSALAGGYEGLSLLQADGRDLPFEDASFDHAYSISVLEHIPGAGDAEALRELARVVRPGGRVVLTNPFAEEYGEDWRDAPVYGDQEATEGRYFFERWYDDEALTRLLAGAPDLTPVHRDVVSMSPDLHTLYTRTFPWLTPFGVLFGLLARERTGPPGGIARITLVKEPGGG